LIGQYRCCRSGCGWAGQYDGLPTAEEQNLSYPFCYFNDRVADASTASTALKTHASELFKTAVLLHKSAGHEDAQEAIFARSVGFTVAHDARNGRSCPAETFRIGEYEGEGHSMQLPLTGGCQCGKLRYEISEAPQLVYTCHCGGRWQRAFFVCST